MSPQPSMQHNSFSSNAPVIRMWTDGSVVWPRNFWLKSAGYAIIAQDGSTLESGPVHHWHISSFGTELWAVLKAIIRAKQECIVYTDNQAVADGIAQITCGADPSMWLHAEWWLMIKEIWDFRRCSHPHPFVVVWIPAHCFDQVPLQMITPDMLKARGTSLEHVKNNRLADFAAKDAAANAAAVHPADETWVLGVILRHQQRLVDINAKLAKLNIEDETAKADKADAQPTPEQFYPQWPWRADIRQYPWKPKIPVTIQLPESKWATKEGVQALVKFFGQCRWCKDKKEDLSYAELAITFLVREKPFHIWDPQITTVKEILVATKKTFLELLQTDGVSLCPGKHDPWGNRSIGRMLPTGTLKGASLFRSDAELAAFSNALDLGASKNLETWSFFINELFF